MDELLDLYKAIAERDTGFWIDLPAATGQQVLRAEWMSLMKEDPDRFQLATLPIEELTHDSVQDRGVIERAVVVTWSDEKLH
ncbi:hypothetical protein ACHAC9_07990 [Massilia sp. CMS3.1]|uniref:hypothetical protein n=1 Tax=Massilia sp. CMS3.1 TaxID=3373083 RepID=UPI003EE45D7F